MNIKKIAITSINFLMTITFMISIIACDLIKTPTSQEVSEETIIETITIQAEKADDFTVSTVFSDNMVVQRNERLRIFGFANENQNNKKIVADFMGMHSEGLVENGKWEIVFPHEVKENLNTDGKNILEVKSNTKTYSFKNILIGDVYMIIGQSNVAYSLLDHFNYLESLPLEQAIVKGDSSILNKNAPIRINYNGLDQETTNYVRGSVDVCKEPSASSYKGWQTPTIENIKNFSALGYYFAYNYLKHTDNSIPIGLIEINGNGQPIGSFLPNDVADRTESDTYDQSKGYYVTEGINGKSIGRFLYNEFMYSFENLPIAGVVWYQGESDLLPAQMNEYVSRFRLLVKHMRSTHNLDNPNFPIYLLEFPTIYQKPSNYIGTNDWAYLDVGRIRGVIGSIPSKIANTYLCVSSNLWSDDTYWNNLHPNCKFEQGERLANLVGSINGDFGTLEQATGPIISSISYSNDNKTATLTFSNVGNGLSTYDQSNEVKGFFALNGENNPYYECNATITSKNTIKITCDYAMKGVAYNIITTNYYGKDINLCNSNGNPCGAFMINK